MAKRRYSRSAEASRYRKLYHTKRWKALRHWQLQDEPTCRWCGQQGRVTAADTVDHIKPHRGDVALFHDPDNLQSLCASCHSRHGQAKDAGKPMAGADLTGAPLDPGHHWNR